MPKRASAYPKIVIIGAGPAGLRAAETLVEAGLFPVVIDEGQRPGGQVYRQPSFGETDGRAAYGFEVDKAAAIHAIPDRLGDDVDYRPGTLVWNLDPGRLETLAPGGLGTLRYDRLILATGAMDRVLPFPGWTTPGVFTLGGAQIALKAQGLAIGRRVALVGAGPLLPLIAYQYAKAGAKIAAVLDVTPFAPKLANLPAMLAQPKTLAKGLWYILRNRLRGIATRSGVRAIRVEGIGRVEALVWTDASGTDHRVACDAVGASFGLRSETQLADLAGCRFRFDDLARHWVPEQDAAGRSSVASVYLAGDGAGIQGADAAELRGRRAALALLEDLGKPVSSAEVARLETALAAQAKFRVGLEQAYPFPGHLLDAVGDDELLCRCEGITIGTLRAAVRTRDVAEINRLKAFTRIGMGRCQGRVCGQAAAELLARELGCPVAEVGRQRPQPPIKPIPLSPRMMMEAADD